ncbi:MAG: TadE-like protein [Chloroflexota bacterium]|jgi:Flp pilus assembly protein TadG|nr:TadE-like protein [Chloroflexota bacterium]
MRLGLRRAAGHRGQSLTEFALVTPVLLLLLAAGSDYARTFFISSAVADATREGALYAVQHSTDPGMTQAGMDSQVRSVLANAEQGGFAPLTCSSWSNPPTSAQVSITFTGSVPPAAGSQTSVSIVATCDILPLFGMRGLPAQYTARTRADALLGPP